MWVVVVVVVVLMRRLVATVAQMPDLVLIVREWTEEKNQRRCTLVDKDIDGTISVAEKAELDQLQAELLAYRHTVAPLPLVELRQVYQELLSH